MEDENIEKTPKDKADLLARIQREWSALMQTVEKLMNDPARRDRMGQAGLSLMEHNRGALDLTLDAIGKLL